ncbi:MAG: type II secretion system protein [SAR324 cluster bacterium]|nr:type II secretion system protein [SAR324 cluster bacterium]
MSEATKPSGFSMLELLVSISIMSLIMVLIYSAFFQISNYSIQVKNTLQGKQELRLLMRIVLDDLQSVQFLEQFTTFNNPSETVYQTGIISKRDTRNEYGENSSIHFHAAIPTRFFPEYLPKDPQLHEVGYFLQLEPETGAWSFKRREDFYIDDNLTEGGREHELSRKIIEFQLEFLEKRLALADGSIKEQWVNEWNSKEDSKQSCRPPSIKESKADPCLPVALKLTMALKDEQNQVFRETLEINLLEALQR